MKLRLRIVALGLLLVAVVAPAALADDCDTRVLPAALDVALAQTQTGEAFVQLVGRMDGYVSACPDHPWVTFMGAEFDMRAYEAVTTLNGGTPNQEAVNYLARAFQRTGVFYAASEEARKERYHVRTPSNKQADLTYRSVSEVRKSVLRGLMQVGRMGTMHPYLSGADVGPCTGWLTSDSQTVAYAIDTKADLIFLPFVDAAAEACRNPDKIGDRLPLAMKAYLYLRLVQKELVTEPGDIRARLRTAKEAEQAYLGGRKHDFFFTEFNGRELDKLMRAHGVSYGDQPALVPRELWFTPEHVSRPETIYTIALSLSDKWSPIAAGTTRDSPETVTAVRIAFNSFITALRAEGDQAGLKLETHKTLRAAIDAFQSGEVRTPEMKGVPGMPEWQYKVLMVVLPLED
ncbi:MAG: hypothetical protein ACK4HR_03025 [Hyphomonas sp.]|jgi:hypothetical protein